jgi:hypothetical protein
MDDFGPLSLGFEKANENVLRANGPEPIGSFSYPPWVSSRFEFLVSCVQQQEVLVGVGAHLGSGHRT